jgi:hypothetical protein
LKNKKVYEAVLEYRGSEHGWGCKDFHSRAYHKDWTITLFKIQDGDCVGGFTTKSWHHRDDNVRDDNAFLFNLSCARLFPSQHSGIDILCSPYRGPAFRGEVGWELVAVNEPFNGENNCCSWANYPGYKIGMETDGVTNKLTRK